MKELIVVTGGLGYIGSHTVVALIEANYEVLIVDNLSNSTISALDCIESIVGFRPEFHQLDLCDKFELDVFFKECQKSISAIIHFAAFKNVGESTQNPLKYYRNNLDSLINLIDLMNLHNVSNLVFSSSCSVYGDADTIPVKENTKLQLAASPYGNTKRISEDIIQDSAKIGMVSAISLRYFNPIGAHPSGNLGEFPSKFADNIMPALTETASGKRKELLVYGNTYNTIDGSCIRDYIDIMDLAEAHICAVRRMLEVDVEGNLEVFNIGTGKGVSVLELISSFERVTGNTMNYKIVDSRDGDVEKIYADPSLANSILGWKAKHSLDDSVRTSWSWQQNIN